MCSCFLIHKVLFKAQIFSIDTALIITTCIIYLMNVQIHGIYCRCRYAINIFWEEKGLKLVVEMFRIFKVLWKLNTNKQKLNFHVLHWEKWIENCTNLVLLVNTLAKKLLYKWYPVICIEYCYLPIQIKSYSTFLDI